MSAIQAIWHGTDPEARALTEALEHHCDCRMDAGGARVSTCTAHRMLLSDQRALDGLLWMRRIAHRLRTEEFGPPGNQEDGSAPKPGRGM